MLNVIADKINSYVTDKRFTQSNKVGQDFVTEAELRDALQTGSKTKAILLTLIQLKRLYSEKKNEDTIFLISS